MTLATGETLTADIVIGADGPTSMVRRMVLDREDDAEPGGFTVFGGSVSADEMKKYPELEKWATSEEVRTTQFRPCRYPELCYSLIVANLHG